MRHLSLTCALALLASGALASGQAPSREVDNIVAFARLYGVVRFFYPSDAAADIDWNRIAVHGSKQVRAAGTTAELEAALKALTSPLGPGIEIGRTLPPAPPPGEPDTTLIAWRYFGAGLAPQGPGNVYRAKRTNRAAAASAEGSGFATMMQTVPALNLRGKTIRLRGQVRATPRDQSGSAALWLRVDRPNQQMGFFDNMGDRPIREGEWKAYTIEGAVAADAVNVAFGAMAMGAITADFETIGLEVRGADGSWAQLPVNDPGFEAADGAGSGWIRAGTAPTFVVSRPPEKAPEGRQFLRIAAPPGPVSSMELFTSAAPGAGAHIDIDLGSGLKARVPLALTSAQASATSPGLDALRTGLAGVKESIDPADVDTRFADAIVAWNVFRHFYPYWTEVRTDWDARLRPQLELLRAATTRDAHRDALRQLAAELRDGHGNVIDVRRRPQRAALPVVLDLIDGKLVITASTATDVPVGAIVTSIDGDPADRRFEDAARLVSGSPQWKQFRASREMAFCTFGAVVNLTFETGSGKGSSALKCDAKQAPLYSRPAAATELSPGIWYVDLTRARMPEISNVMEKVAAATGVVFDVRGYPTDAGVQLLPHLLDAAENDRWMHVNKITGPFGQSAGWESMGWNLKPGTPRLTGKIVFLTNGSAISYAESVMGYVADRRLGTIVGGPTAGANGNVATFPVPGGFMVSFTGMRVTGHDGSTAFHAAGITPHIAVAPTLAGIRTGKDEVLERGLAVIRGK